MFFLYKSIYKNYSLKKKKGNFLYFFSFNIFVNNNKLQVLKYKIKINNLIIFKTLRNCNAS